ncbi:uncharacterized protein BN726_00085 [Clostridium sp. CAG:594]|nr:uncharacterized protein BN726_00085 [Clostridium sp. CAG:594]
MSELTIMHKYGISATYYDNKFEAVQKDDLNKMLDEFNKRDINVHNIYFNGDDLECFIGKLKVILKDYYYFQNDSRFDFIFNKLKSYKLCDKTKNAAKVVAGILAISSIISVAAYKVNNKNHESYESYVEPSYSTIYVDSNPASLDNDINKKIDSGTINADKKDADKKDYEETKNNNVLKAGVISNLQIEDESESEKANKTKELYYDIIEKYANMYGVLPSVILAIATQERGVHSDTIDPGGAIGLMQVQASVWDGKDLEVYNYDTNSKEKIHITLDNLRDVSFNIKVGCAIFQNYLKQMKDNYPLAIQSYNMGPSSVNKILNAYCLSCGKTYDEVINSDDLGWLSFRNSSYPGDSFYLEHVLRYDNNVKNSKSR